MTGAPLLLDHVRAGLFAPPPWADYRHAPAVLPELVRQARQAVPVVVTNATDYFYAGTDQEDWDVREDFPCVAPPWPTFWLEYERPPRIVSRVHGVVVPDARQTASRYGVLFTSVDREALLAYHGPRDGQPGYRERRLAWLQEHRVAWGVEANLWVAYPAVPAPVGPLVTWLLHVDEDGRALGDPHAGTQRYEGLPDHEWPAEELRDMVTGLSGVLHACLFALSLLHCKNVAQEETAPAVSRPVRRAWERQHGAPPTRYRVLRIDPLREALRREAGYGGPGGPTLARALHVVRGHFAVYSEAAPLFGRVAGRFWRPQHARGTASAGRVDKSYAVDAPVPKPPETRAR